MAADISPEAREAAAAFWDFLGHHGTAKNIREGNGFRTTAEVFAAFQDQISAAMRERNEALALQVDELEGKYAVVSEMNQTLLDFVRGIANAPDAACARAEQAWIWRDIAREWFE
jgi:hypothetical protein